ncbi:hypothetical protein KEM54_005775 [Ascosphaera aggregata]|nr:hypothetical protein KEM54_005775 [Ascosphaera aggregata]
MSSQQVTQRPQPTRIMENNERPRSRTYSKSPYPWKPEQIFIPGSASTQYGAQAADFGRNDSLPASSDYVSSPARADPGGAKRQQTISQSSICFTAGSYEVDYERGDENAKQDEETAHLQSLRLIPSTDRSVSHEELGGPVTVTPSIKIVRDGFSHYAGRSPPDLRMEGTFISEENEDEQQSTDFGPAHDLDLGYSGKDDSSKMMEDEQDKTANSSPNIYVHCLSPQFNSSLGSQRRRSFPSCESSPNVIILNPSSPRSGYVSSPNHVRLMPSESTMASPHFQSPAIRPFRRYSFQGAFSPASFRNSIPPSPVDLIIYSDIIPYSPRRSSSRTPNPAVRSRRHTVASQPSLADLTLDVRSPSIKSKSSHEQQLDSLLALIDGRKTIVHKKHLSGSVSSPGTDILNFEWSLKHSPNHDSFGAKTAPSSFRNSIQEFSDIAREKYRHHYLSNDVIAEEGQQQHLGIPSSSRTIRNSEHDVSANYAMESVKDVRPSSAPGSIRTYATGITRSAVPASDSSLVYTVGFPPWVPHYYDAPSRGPSLFARSSANSTSRLPERLSGNTIQSSHNQDIRNTHLSATTESRTIPAASLGESSGDWSQLRQTHNEKQLAAAECTAPKQATDEHDDTSSSFESGRWSPHLTRDRGARTHLIFVEPALPSTGSTKKSPYHLQQKSQVILFVSGFICPVLWFIASVLPLPKRKNGYSVENGTTPEDISYSMDDPYLENARWWRRKNRYMSPVGVMVIICLVSSNFSTAARGFSR